MTLAFIGGESSFIAIAVIAVVLLGSQAPKLARNLGLAGKEFRKAQDEAEEEERQRAAAKAVAAAPPVAVSQTTADDKVTLSRTELDALLAEREARAKREASSS